ncbi:MAG: DUF6702 family protein [Saprospiraceae bacterium]
MKYFFVLFLHTISPSIIASSAIPAYSLHDFHLSKCLIEYNTTDQAIQISMQVFIDDLEEALRREGKDHLALCTPKEAPDAEQHFQNYLLEHFHLAVNGQEVTYNYLGKEISEDLSSLWCYLEIEAVTNINSIKVSNDLLMETFEDQQNIISIKGPNNQSGMWLFKKGSSSNTVSFKQ